jgi:hypothetical protein
MARFIWDAENRAHIARHGVTPAEFEQAYATRGILRQALAGERRKIAFGATRAGRILVIVYTMRRGRVRAITAYESRKARREWRS